VTTAPERPLAKTPPPRQAVRQRRKLVRSLRPARRWGAVPVATLLLGAGALTVIEIVLARLERAPLVVPRAELAQRIAASTWDHSVVLLGAGLAALVGILLLLLAVLPGRTRAVLVGSADTDMLLAIGRRSLRRLLARDARRVVGVQRARVAVRRRRIVVHAHGRAGAPVEARGEVREALERRLADLQLTGPAGQRVHVRWKEQRR
jgi:uncharacterized protein DUF6286